MSKRFIMIVLDGFGVGAMKDTKDVRVEDVSSNTFASILRYNPNLKLKNLEALGLMNAYHKESERMKFSPSANATTAELMHFGADTFSGHQEMMGTKPKQPRIQPFSEVIDEVEQHLLHNSYKVVRKEKEGLYFLVVNDYVTVGDNIDADYGIQYNCTAPLDYISFEEELAIARCVREVVKVNRVIPFGGTGNTMEDVLSAAQTREGRYIGIHAVNSKSYAQGYQVLHLGYGVDERVQVPTILGTHKIPVSLFGKVADIVINEQGESVSCVDTEAVLDATIKRIEEMEYGFICTNVQETDLAGHAQDVVWYENLLKKVDQKLSDILPLLSSDDILLICADHGNDPLIGHNKHTRECVPVLIYKKGTHGKKIHPLKSLSDLGATVCDYFGVEPCENGTSFLKELTD